MRLVEMAVVVVTPSVLVLVEMMVRAPRNGWTTHMGALAVVMVVKLMVCPRCE